MTPRAPIGRYRCSFKNETGGIVIMGVDRIGLEQATGVSINMSRPDSAWDNTLTLKEARELHEALGLVLLAEKPA